MVGFIVLLPPRCSNLHFALFSHYLDRKCEFYGILDERNGLDVVIETIPCPIRANIQIIVINAVITSFSEIKIKIETNFLSLALSLCFNAENIFLPEWLIDCFSTIEKN